MSKCLTMDEIADLAGESLPSSQRGRLLRHCEGCPACMYELEEWKSNAAYALDVRSAVEHFSSDAGSPAKPGGVSTSTRVLPLMEKDSIRGYEILGEIHRGGQGVVYHAIQKSTRREVAIKVAFAADGPRVAASRRFNREIEISALFKHPNIITVFDSGTTQDGRRFFVMDFVRGLPLDQYVREHDLDREKTLAVFLQVCDAVNYAHQRAVIHRDLKPSNILVDSEGLPYVLDFGIAKALHSIRHVPASTISTPGQILGTIPYMAPEQLAGSGLESGDVRADVYALGVLLHELLAGCLPYGAIPSAPYLLDRMKNKETRIRQAENGASPAV